MDPNIWIVKLLLTWIISSISCDTSGTSANGQTSNVAEFIRHNVDPLTHMEITSDRRPRRAPYSSLFEHGYDEFLRDHFKNSNENERKGNYRAKESESDESGNESDNSESDERSEESEEKPKKNQHNAKTNAKSNRQKDHSPAKTKKSKHCKTEKRGNMLCSVCFNSKTDEKSESCSFNSEPKKKNYAYSTDNKYENKNRERESYEKGNDPEDGDDDDENENENENEESDGEEVEDEKDEEKLEIAKGQRVPHPIVPVQRPAVPFNPRFYPPNGPYPNRPLPFRPIPVRPNPNYYGPPRIGPQVFPQQYRGAPVRLQVPPNSAVIRYRTVGSPNGQRHIRIITYPNGQMQTQVFSPGSGQGPQQDLRPPRDVNTEQSILRDITKGLDHFGGGSNDDQKLVDFLKQDWTNCKRFYDTYDEQVCFECVKGGSRGKQCMYAGQSIKKPENFYKEYSTSKKIENDEPYEFDRPKSSQAKHRTKQKHQRKQKPDKHHNGNSSNFGHDPAPVYEQNPYDWKNVDFSGKQQRRPQAEQLRAGTCDIIYGKIIPGAEPLGLFFNKDFGHFNTTTTTNTEKTI